MKKNLKFTVEIGCNRLWLCAVCVLLLWVTTFETATAIAKMFLRPPDLGFVKETCMDEYARVDMQREDYRNCVNAQMETCSENLDAGVISELHRAGNASITNENEITEVLKVSTDAATILKRIKFSTANYMDQLASREKVMPYRDESVCSSSLKTYTQDLLDDRSDIIAPTSDKLNAFTSITNDRMSHLAEHIAAVDAYNQHYVSNKTASLQRVSVTVASSVLPPTMGAINTTMLEFHQSLQQLLNCLSLDPSSSKQCECSVNHNSAYDLYTQAETTMNAQLLAIEAVFEDIEADLEEWKSEVAAALENADDFFSTVGDVMEDISSTFGISELCGLTDPDWCDFGMNDWFVDVNSISISPRSLNFMANASAMWSQLGAAVALTDANFTAITQRVSELAHGAKVDVENALMGADFTPDDYNPPTYGYAENASVETLNQRADGVAFSQNITYILDGLLVNVTAAPDLLGGVSALGALSLPLSSIIKSEFSSTWTAFRNDKLDIDTILVGATALQALVMVFDLTYRILQTFKIVRRHWNGSMVELPVINMKTVKLSWSQSLCTFLAYVDSIGAVAVLLVVFAALVAFIIVSVYTASLVSYRSACVTHESNSTYIMRGMHSLAFNYASMEGNLAMSRGVMAHNERATSECVVHSRSAESKYQSFADTFKSLNASYRASVHDVDAISTCLDVSVVDSSYKSVCCHYADYRNEYESCSSVLTNGTCALDTFTGDVIMPPSYYAERVPSFAPFNASLDRGRAALFSCEELPTCTISCGGPDYTVVSSSAQMCSCSAEWYFHSGVIQILLMCTIYVTINASRMLVTRGIGMVVWRHLIRAPVLECRLECSEEGEIIQIAAEKAKANPPSSPPLLTISDVEEDRDRVSEEYEKEVVPEVTPEMMDTSRNLHHIIEKTLRHYYVKGWLYIALGGLLNAFWLVPLPILDDSITYRPDHASV